MTTHSHDYFRQVADEYDSMAPRAMPWCDDMLAELVRCLPEDAASVLELGCGTGSLTALLAAKYPGASITAVDAVEEMVEVARSPVGGASGAGRPTFLVSTFEDFDA
jgi:trans-aconitate methyltransferase